MFLYFKRREKRGKREAPRPRFLVLRRKTLTVGAALLAAAAIFGAVNAPAAVRASVATRQLPIYCVERDQKVCSISFDAAWGADNTQRILDVLPDYGVKCTFFVVGNWADQYPDEVRAAGEQHAHGVLFPVELADERAGLIARLARAEALEHPRALLVRNALKEL